MVVSLHKFSLAAMRPDFSDDFDWFPPHLFGWGCTRPWEAEAASSCAQFCLKIIWNLLFASISILRCVHSSSSTVTNPFYYHILMENSNSTLLSATHLNPSVNVTEYPVHDAGRWMQNRLDGTFHPAFNTDVDGLVHDSDKEKLALLADDEPLNLCVRRYEFRSDNKY